MHVVSAWASEEGIALGQVATQEKSNEITAIPVLLRQIELTDALVTIEALPLNAEVRLIFLELGRAFGLESLAGECSPAIDVFETDDSLEIAMDLPGVSTDAVRVIGKGDSILIAGEKPARRARGEARRAHAPSGRVVLTPRACANHPPKTVGSAAAHR